MMKFYEIILIYFLAFFNRLPPICTKIDKFTHQKFFLTPFKTFFDIPQLFFATSQIFLPYLNFWSVNYSIFFDIPLFDKFT